MFDSAAAAQAQTTSVTQGMTCVLPKKRRCNAQCRLMYLQQEADRMAILHNGNGGEVSRRINRKQGNQEKTATFSAQKKFRVSNNVQQP